MSDENLKAKELCTASTKEDSLYGCQDASSRASSMLRLFRDRVTKEAKVRFKNYHRYRNIENKLTLRIAEKKKVATIRRTKDLYFREAIYKTLVSPRGI